MAPDQGSDLESRDPMVAKVFLGFAAATFAAVLQLITLHPLTPGLWVAIYAFALSLPINLLFGLARSSETPNTLIDNAKMAYFGQLGPYLAMVGFISLFFTFSESAGYGFLAMSLLCIVIFLNPYMAK